MKGLIIRDAKSVHLLVRVKSFLIDRKRSGSLAVEWQIIVTAYFQK